MWYLGSMSIIINLIVSAVVILVLAAVLPGVTVTGFGTAVVVAVVLGLVNALLKPILVFLTLPINILTLGLFSLVINALLIILVSSVVPGFDVASFWWALVFGILLSIVVSILP